MPKIKDRYNAAGARSGGRESAGKDQYIETSFLCKLARTRRRGEIRIIEDRYWCARLGAAKKIPVTRRRQTKDIYDTARVNVERF